MILQIYIYIYTHIYIYTYNNRIYCINSISHLGVSDNGVYPPGCGNFEQEKDEPR